MTPELRRAVDTNVLVSARLWQGVQGHVIELDRDQVVQLCTSKTLLEGLAATLAKPKLAKYVDATDLSAAHMLSNHRRLAKLIPSRSLARQVSRDADDDAMLDCALAVHAHLIVTGDDDLLVLMCSRNIPILNPLSAMNEASAR